MALTPFTHVRRIVITTAILFAPAGAAAQNVDRPILSPLPSASSIRTSANAAATLKRLYFISDYNDGAALGDALYARFKLDPRVRFWYVVNIARTTRSRVADSITAHIDTASRDPWALAARAIALEYKSIGRRAAIAQAIRLSERARQMAPHDPDLTWASVSVQYNANEDPKYAKVIAYIDSVAPLAGNPAELMVMRANALYSASSFPPPDTAKREAAYRAYTAARAADTSNFSAIFFAADRLSGVRDSDALALLKRAVALSPRSTNVRSTYWRALNAQKSIPADERKSAIAADRDAFLTLTDSAPWAMASVIGSMRSLKASGVAALEERVLAKAPRSGWSENVLRDRADAWSDSLRAATDTTVAGSRPDSVDMKKKYRAASEAFINRPWRANDEAVGFAALQLFFNVREDTTYPTAKLVQLVKLMSQYGYEPNASSTHLAGAVTLATRKADLPLAEKLVDEGARIVGANLMAYPDHFFSSIGERAEAMELQDSQILDTRGWVYFNEGRLPEAEKQFERSLDMSKKNATTYFHLGKLRTTQGRADEAELAFAQGMTIRVRGMNPNLRELESIYKSKHATMDGWKSYLADLEEKERTARKAKILLTRGENAAKLPVFSLADLTGKTVKSEDLKSKYTVVNFWGTWCGPCVAEMPELQQFYDKYRADSTVQVLTVSNDKELQELKDWMTKRKLTIPTLFDKGDPGLTGTTGILAWPTTLFIDRDGQTQFNARGNSGALVEEWSWRLEAMRMKNTIVP